MSPTQRLDPKTARHTLTDHPYYRYRGCAPDPDDPRMAAGNPGLPVTAWEAPDVDGGEPQPVRIARERAAKAVCARCPVVGACAVYGNSLTREGKLAEPYAILGATTALERHKALIAARHESPLPLVPVEHLKTPQKLAFLRALAKHTDPEQIADAAGMDLRTANWQRSILVGKLGLPRTASRRQLLDAAAARGLLDGVPVVADDGTVPAVPAPAKTAASQQLTLNLWAGRTAPAAHPRPKSTAQHAQARGHLRLVAWTAEPLPLPTARTTTLLEAAAA